MTTHVEWGPNGLRAMVAATPRPDVVVVVDVLRFTTAVSVAVERGAAVIPCRWADDGAAEFAAACDAVQWSLSPVSLRAVPAGTRLVLPSPNGSALAVAAHEAGGGRVLAGCLRNATAVGEAARRIAGDDGTVAVVAAGERWKVRTGPLRVAVEDQLGAGAAAQAAAGEPSPEAAVAIAAFASCRDRISEIVSQSTSGRELLDRGHGDDVEMACELDATDVVPVLVEGAFVRLT